TSHSGSSSRATRTSTATRTWAGSARRSSTPRRPVENQRARELLFALAQPWYIGGDALRAVLVPAADPQVDRPHAWPRARVLRAAPRCRAASGHRRRRAQRAARRRHLRALRRLAD